MMASFQNLPSELRQKILFSLFPPRTRNPQQPPRNLRRLMEVSPQFEADIMECTKIWSPKHFVTHPTALHNLFGTPQIRNLKLSLFHDYTLEQLHVNPSQLWSNISATWKDVVPEYARGDIRTIAIDITPLPGSMRYGRSRGRWQCILVNDSRARLYMEDCGLKFIEFIERLVQPYWKNPDFELHLTGCLGMHSKDDMRDLYQILRQRWGVKVIEKFWVMGYETNSISTALEILSHPGKNQFLEVGKHRLKDFAWSPRTYYWFHVNISRTGRETYRLLKQYVTFVGQLSDTPSTPRPPHPDFFSYNLERRALVQSLIHDLGYIIPEKIPVRTYDDFKKQAAYLKMTNVD